MDGDKHTDIPTAEWLHVLLIRCGQKLGSSGPRQTQGRILKILYLHGPMTQGALQEKLGIQPGSMSEIAAKLERKGLLLRERDGADKRKVFLSLTDAGRADVEEHRAKSRFSGGHRFAALSEEEQQTLCMLLEKLMRSWE
ncbi:MAG: MarR family transcriptional regulator [Eubacteriales bacterium]|nr:MarR family transcriptional regulator [Eubacteriales bacterium]